MTLTLLVAAIEALLKIQIAIWLHKASINGMYEWANLCDTQLMGNDKVLSRFARDGACDRRLTLLICRVLALQTISVTSPFSAGNGPIYLALAIPAPLGIGSSCQSRIIHFRGSLTMLTPGPHDVVTSPRKQTTP